MKNFLKVALWATLLLACGGAFSQQLINCAPNIPCTSTGPKNTGTGDPPWVGGGKINTNAINFAAAIAALQAQAAPVVTPRAPPQAAAAGYNTLTYGPNVTLGTNWQLFNALNVTPLAGQAVQNLDGSVTLPGADGSNFGANIATASLVGGVLKGTAFRGGMYVEFLVKFTPTLGSANLPFPALWALDSGTLANNQLQWPGQTPGFFHRIELDFVQWPHNSLGFWEGAGLIDWFGQGILSTPKLLGPGSTGTPTIVGATGQFQCNPTTLIAGNYITVFGTLGGTGAISGYSPTAAGHPYLISTTNGSTTFTLTEIGGATVNTTAGTPTGLYFSLNNITAPNPQIGAEIKMGPITANPFLFSTYQRYGFLVTPATASTTGSVLNYLNDVQVNYAAGAPNAIWTLYNPANGPPPVLGSTAGSLIDTLGMVLIMGTDASSPMTIISVSVWQASGNSNIISSLWMPAANDDEYFALRAA